jgi:very-short-patch-repair endonuclease
MDDFSVKYKEYNRGHNIFAREMRKNPTPAEEKMWQEILKNRP